MKRIVIFFLISSLFVFSFLAFWNSAPIQNKQLPELFSEKFNFIVLSDIGEHDKSVKRNVAHLIGQLAEKNRIDFVAVAGDPFHGDGVQSINDKVWEDEFENVYTASSLQKLPFYVVSGNHEYHGNVQAILDYSAISERWNAHARYFSFERSIDEQQKALFVFIDTTPLIDDYRQKYSEAGEQCLERQLLWLDSTLFVSNSRWKIVIGHHPIYAHTEKLESQQSDLQERVGKILENHSVDFYISGHIHNFQYIRTEDKMINYIVNPSVSDSREVSPIKGTIFCYSDSGFTLFTISADSVQFSFINHIGKQVYQNVIRK